MQVLAQIFKVSTCHSTMSLLKDTGTDDRFSEKPSVAVRYPGLVGIEIFDAICRDYEISAGDVVLNIIDEHGNQLLFRHKLNNRDPSINRELLVQSMLSEGLIEGVGGQLWCVPIPGKKDSIEITK